MVGDSVIGVANPPLGGAPDTVSNLGRNRRSRRAPRTHSSSIRDGDCSLPMDGVQPRTGSALRTRQRGPRGCGSERELGLRKLRSEPSTAQRPVSRQPAAKASIELESASAGPWTQNPNRALVRRALEHLGTVLAASALAATRKAAEDMSMKNQHSSHANLLRGVFAGALALACSAEVPDSMSVATPEFDAQHGEAPSEAVVHPDSTVVAKFALGPTHEVEFREYPHLGIAVATETLHADLDRDAPNLAKRGVRHGMPIHEIYRIVAGEDADPAIFEHLRKIKERFAALGRPNLGSTASDQLDSVARPTNLETERPGVASEIEPQAATLTQAICTEPQWNWQSDEAWFKNNYCYSASQYCDSLDPSHVSSVFGRTSDSDHFNQSHCSEAKIEINLGRWEWCDSLDLCIKWTNVFKGLITPRVIKSFYFNLPHPTVKVQTKIQSLQGNFTGLAHFAFSAN
jgi:hypothetical protein